MLRGKVSELRPEFALDTNTIIYALKGMGRVRERLTLTAPSRIAIPSVALYELEYGTLRSSNSELRRRELLRLLNVIHVLPFDKAAAERAAEIRVDLEKRGQTIGPLDLMIAGTALASGCRLVTHNIGEFSRIGLLPTEDWY